MTSTIDRPSTNGTAAVFRAYQQCAWYELILMRHGFTPDRLLRLARRVSNDWIKANVPHIGDKREDLVAAMYERGLKRAIVYDPAKTNGNGDYFESFIAKHMEHAAMDFFRRKSEGFGDRRYGNDGKVVLSEMDDEVDDHFVEQRLTSRRRIARWKATAERTGFTFEEFVSIALDRECEIVERSAA